MPTTPTQTELILNSIESAEKSLALVKKLLGVEAGRVPQGVTGVFNGEFMVTDEGKRYQVPPNYASKSMLVVGDTLKYIPGDDTGALPQFKQITKVERIKSQGVLSKKDGRWAVVCEQGSFWVLPSAVKFFAGEIGQEVQMVLPQDFKKLNAQWAAIESPVLENKGQESKKTKEQEIKQEERTKGEESKEVGQDAKGTDSPPAKPVRMPPQPIAPEQKASVETVKVQEPAPAVSPKPPAAQRPLPEIKEIKGEIKIEEITDSTKIRAESDEELR